MKRIFLSILFFSAMYSTVSAQEKTKEELAGDKCSFKYDYTKAVECYASSKVLTVDGQRHLAEGYYKLGQTAKSEFVYANLIGANASLLPEDYYNYSMVLKSLGKYEASDLWFNKFALLKPNDLRAIDFQNHSAMLKTWRTDTLNNKVQHLNINTAAEDFAPSYYNNQVVFVSSRADNKLIKRKYNWNGQPFLDLYVAQAEGVELKDAKPFNATLNGRLHDGPVSFSNNGDFLAYSANGTRDKTKDKVVELRIMFSANENGKWSEPIPFAFNSEDYSVGHPSLTGDGKTMYFTSNMPGGFGGADLYRTTKNPAGEWSKPENLGSRVNTEGDEMFPFIQEKNNVLFFASNGRYGLGGMDIFVCAMNGASFGVAINAGSPINTQHDDFALIINSDMNIGYLSSNRGGGKGGDDIYGVSILKSLNIGKKIEGLAKDKDGVMLPGTFISLLDKTDHILDTMTTKADGMFAFMVETNKDFRVVGNKQNYMQGDTLTNTFGDVFLVKADVVLLTKEEIVAKKIHVGADLAVIVQFDYDKIYFDLDKFNIRIDAEMELTKIIEVMNRFPDLIVQLNAYTDSRATDEYNQVLSNKRAKASVDYIRKRITHPERIYGKGYGETNLVNSCTALIVCSEVEHQKNRRTEFIIMKH